MILASAENQFNLYTMPLDELATDQSAKQITSTANFKSDAQFSPDSKEVYYIENGRVNIVNLERREVRPLALNLEMNVNFAQEKMEIFKQGWRYLRDNFYDDKYHGADWNAVEKTYEPLIAGARNDRRNAPFDVDDGRRIERFASRRFRRARALRQRRSANSDCVSTATEYETNGRLKITEIIALSPADITRRRQSRRLSCQR